MKPLEGKVAVVAGATRGAGRGIACALGDAGATVYCTGRSVRGRAATPGRPETIEETAERVDSAGGKGIAVRVDHTQEPEVEALFARVRAEQGRLDVLVNDIWGGDTFTEFGTPLWKLDLAKGRAILESALWTHIVTARHGLPLMVEKKRGLVVEITDGDFVGYRGAFFYDLAKIGAIRLAYAYAAELRHHAITAVAVTPGFLRSEFMLDRFGVTESNWQEAAKKDPHFLQSETPAYVGRAVAALAADPNVHAKNGKVFASWTLAREYGFTDVDGRRPDWGRYFDGVTAEILARGTPPDPDARFLLEARSFQLDLDPAKAEERARVLELLGRGPSRSRSAPGRARPRQGRRRRAHRPRAVRP
jgi:NAD(P)-dependent dehydrogenase (short-subunit alcohol dehydrogenase family)